MKHVTINENGFRFINGLLRNRTVFKETSRSEQDLEYYAISLAIEAEKNFSEGLGCFFVVSEKASANDIAWCFSIPPDGYSVKDSA